MKNKKNQCQGLSNHYTVKSVGKTLEKEIPADKLFRINRFND